MKLDLKRIGLTCLYVAIAFSVGRFMGPSDVETKEVEKVVYKDRVVTNDQKETHVETRETVLPDGTRIKEVIRDRKQQSTSDSNREVASEKSQESKTSNRPNWSIGAYTNKEFVASTIDRRILGGLFLGVYGRTNIPYSNPEYGLGLRLQF